MPRRKIRGGDRAVAERRARSGGETAVGATPGVGPNVRVCAGDACREVRCGDRCHRTDAVAPVGGGAAVGIAAPIGITIATTSSIITVTHSSASIRRRAAVMRLIGYGRSS